MIHLLGLPRCTKGKTWEQIYGPEYAAVKRAQAIAIGHLPMSEAARARLRETRRRLHIAGMPGSFRGKTHSAATKAKIAAVRRERYGTRASLNKQLRYTQKYRQWRTAVFKRDAYTCQHCGNNTLLARRRVMLHAHHIIELWVLLGSMTLNEAMTNEAVWDKTNAVTLCQPCHRRIPVTAYWAPP